MTLKHFYIRSIKPIETEEPFDLIFNRPLGLLLVLILRPLPISPNLITVFSMITGITSGYFFARGDHISAQVGAVLLMLANILDCTDGQLARIRGASSMLGKTLDGLCDVVTYLSIAFGVAYSMVQKTASLAWLWWLYAWGVMISGIIHIHFFDHFKNELIFYALPDYHEKLESTASLKAQRRAIENSPGHKWQKFMLSVYIFFYTMEERVIRLAQPKNYRGYIPWFQMDASVPYEIKESFKKNYRRYNRLLVLGWSLLGATAHVSVFIIAGLFNRLDWVFWILCVPFTLWMFVLILLQRFTLKHQLRMAYQTLSTH